MAKIQGRKVEYIIVDDLTKDRHSYLMVHRGSGSPFLRLLGGTLTWYRWMQYSGALPYRRDPELTTVLQLSVEPVQTPEQEHKSVVLPADWCKPKVYRPELMVKLVAS